MPLAVLQRQSSYTRVMKGTAYVHVQYSTGLGLDQKYRYEAIKLYYSGDKRCTAWCIMCMCSTVQYSTELGVELESNQKYSSLDFISNTSRLIHVHIVYKLCACTLYSSNTLMCIIIY